MPSMPLPPAHQPQDNAMAMIWEAIRSTPFLDSLPALAFSLLAALAIRETIIWWQNRKQARTWEKWHGRHEGKAAREK